MELENLCNVEKATAIKVKLLQGLTPYHFSPVVSIASILDRKDLTCKEVICSSRVRVQLWQQISPKVKRSGHLRY